MDKSASSNRQRIAALVAAFLGWMFDGMEMGIFPLVARPALKHMQTAAHITDEGFVQVWMGIVTGAFLILLVVVALAACASGPGAFQYQVPQQPEAASGYTEKPGWATRSFAVAAANPLATDAGYQVLKAGGSATDAAIAVQMVLGLVEPHQVGTIELHKALQGTLLGLQDMAGVLVAAVCQRLPDRLDLATHSDQCGPETRQAPGTAQP